MAAARGGEGIQVQAQARARKADQVRDAHPCVHVLTNFRENTLQDLITKLEPDLFVAVTGLAVKDFHLLVRLKVFNAEQMNQAVFAFRRYEDAWLRYTGIERHSG